MSGKAEKSPPQKKKEVEVDLSTTEHDIAFTVVKNPLQVDKIGPQNANKVLNCKIKIVPAIIKIVLAMAYHFHNGF